MAIKLNPPSLSRPQNPEQDETETYVWQMHGKPQGTDWLGKQRFPINNKEILPDVIWGKAIIPEYQTIIKFPIARPNGKDRFKQKVARLILWFANLIGEKNV